MVLNIFVVVKRMFWQGIIMQQRKIQQKQSIRITSDCPLIDPDIIDLASENYEKQSCDILTNVPNDGQKLTYPRGMDVEIFSFKWLEEAFYHAKETYEREHCYAIFITQMLKRYIMTGQRKIIRDID